MRVLALDAAQFACSVAVRDAAGLRAHAFVQRRRGHGDVLAPMIREAMADAGMSFTDLDAVAVTVGPGSYTGVRVGLSAARGLALAMGCPAVGVTTLEAVARAARDATDAPPLPIMVCLETQRREIYVQQFDKSLTPACSPVAASPETIADLAPAPPLLLAGDAATRVRALFPTTADIRIAPGHGQPDAATVAEIAAERLVAGPPPEGMPRPLYLRPPLVTVTAANRR